MNKESETKEFLPIPWPPSPLFNESETGRTGRFHLRKVVNGIKRTHSTVDRELLTKQYMYAQMCEKLARIICDGREYLIKTSYIWDTKEPDVKLTPTSDIALTLAFDINLVHFVAANIGESVADLPCEVLPSIREWQMSGTMWKRVPWGWQRTA